MSSTVQALLPFLGALALVITITAGGYQALSGTISYRHLYPSLYTSG